jgi:hypothetical protein
VLHKKDRQNTYNVKIRRVHVTIVALEKQRLLNTGCVSESNDFATLLFLVRQHCGDCCCRHFAANFKGFQLQWSRGLEHNVIYCESVLQKR